MVLGIRRFWGAGSVSHEYAVWLWGVIGVNDGDGDGGGWESAIFLDDEKSWSGEGKDGEGLI